MTTQAFGVVLGMYLALFRAGTVFWADIPCNSANGLKFMSIIFMRPVWLDYCFNIQAKPVQVIRKHVL